MRSRVRLSPAHPIHPMLVPFPLAFLLGACAFDIVGVSTATAGWYSAAKYLGGAGVVMGVVAAVPGLVDFIWTVPGSSPAKRRARTHMLLNLCAVVLAAFCFWLRGAPGVPPDPPILALEVLVAALLLWSAFLGGTLVYRDRIGVPEAEESERTRP